MDNFEEKLGSILSNPEQMEKIMALAKSLSSESNEETPQEQTDALPAFADEKTMLTIGKIMSQLKGDKKDKSTLIGALSPYLKPQRRQAMEKAVMIAKLVRISRTIMPGGE